jgi:tetratricopeptide (TPR) repeat protein
MPHIHRLDPTHKALLGRRDLLTKEPLRPGDDIVVCVCHSYAFLVESWSTAASSHGGLENTLAQLPEVRSNIRFSRQSPNQSRRSRQRSVPRADPPDAIEALLNHAARTVPPTRPTPEAPPPRPQTRPVVRSSRATVLRALVVMAGVVFLIAINQYSVNKAALRNDVPTGSKPVDSSGGVVRIRDSSTSRSPDSLNDAGRISRLVDSIRVDPANDELWGDLGDRYLAQRRHAEAGGAFAVALLLNPADLEWQNHAPSLLLAADAIRNAGITDDELVGNVADSAAAVGNHAAAARLYAVAVTLDPTDDEWRDKLASSSASMNASVGASVAEADTQQAPPVIQKPASSAFVATPPLITLDPPTGNQTIQAGTAVDGTLRDNPSSRQSSVALPRDLDMAELARVVNDFNSGRFDAALTSLGEMRARVNAWRSATGRVHVATDSINQLSVRVLRACLAVQAVNRDRRDATPPRCLDPRRL